MKRVILDSEAEREVDNALASSAIADEFRVAIAEAVAGIGANPKQAAQIGRSEIRQYIFTRFPYSIIYLEENDLIRVLAFPHHRQRPGYWKRRLRPN